MGINLNRVNKTSSWVNRNPKITGLLISIFILFVGFLIIDRILLSPNLIDGKNKPNIIRAINLREHHPNINIIINPTKYYLKTTDNLLDQEYPFRTDDNGFILPSSEHKTPDYKIVFIGGSTTECMYVTEKNRFPYKVGKLLEQQTGKSVNTYNSGVSGNATIHSLNIMLNKIIPMQPDAVVIMHGINDYSILAYYHTYWPNETTRSAIVSINDHFPKYDPPSFIGHLKGLVRIVYPNIYQKLYELRNHNEHTNIDDESYDEWKDRRHQIKYRNFKYMQKQFKSALQLLVMACKQYNISPILMTQANRYKTNPDEFILKSMSKMLDAGISYDEFKFEYDSFNEITREVAAENNTILIDLDKLVPQEKEYMYDAHHFNETGAKFAANIITNKLIKSFNE